MAVAIAGREVKADCTEPGEQARRKAKAKRERRSARDHEIGPRTVETNPLGSASLGTSKSSLSRSARRIEIERRVESSVEVLRCIRWEEAKR